ncbi:hypothetical protein BDR06DRAFT_1031907 [Suillus hirtellus]|nr:hypothetical protein BDR06DRAFT_1031907 [Suillus hirtellus]
MLMRASIAFSTLSEWFSTSFFNSSNTNSHSMLCNCQMTPKFGKVQLDSISTKVSYLPSTFTCLAVLSPLWQMSIMVKQLRSTSMEIYVKGVPEVTLGIFPQDYNDLVFYHTSIWIDAGSCADATNGTAYFLEHMTFKAPNIATNMHWNLRLRTLTAYYAKNFRKDVLVTVDIILDILQNPKLETAAIAPTSPQILTALSPPSPKKAKMQQMTHQSLCMCKHKKDLFCSKEHTEMLICLIQITEEHVHKHAVSEASVVTSIAYIRVGKREYQKTLASCATFKNHRTLAYLHMLHIDILTVWSFHDPHPHLDSHDFRNVAADLSTMEAIAGILSVLAGLVATIVLLMVASVVIVKWVCNVYQLFGVVLQCLIVNLTLLL